MARKSDKAAASPAASGLVVGGRGGPEDELLQSGQEEVFSRTEVESGRIEHQADTDGEAGSAKSGDGEGPPPAAPET